MPGRLYLDNASTSFPKAPGVGEAVAEYMSRVGATPGRGSYFEALEGGRIVRQCRERVNALINGESPDHVVFTLNATGALNLAIKGVVAHRRRSRPGVPIHLVASEVDHNSVLRPFSALAAAGVECTVVPVDSEGFVSPTDIDAAVRPDTALVVLSHASNVAGSLQPAAAVGEVCRRRSVLFLLDGAQSLGHVPVDVRAIGADVLAFSGHKGPLGPLGTGGLYLRPGAEAMVDSTLEGGTGTASELDLHPQAMPEKFEAGSPNGPGIAGLHAGVKWLLANGVNDGFSHERGLIDAMMAGLLAGGVRASMASGTGGPLSRFRLLGPADAARRVGVFSLVHESASPHELAAVLESAFGILARAGLHCAPRVHEALGARGGSLRLSLGPFVTHADVRRVLGALVEVAASFELIG